MNEMQIFKKEEFGEVRVIEKNGEPWFVAKDVADILGYSNPSRSIQDHCKFVELLKTTDSVVLDIPTRGLQIIPERDVYRLIMRSNLPKAEQFQDWVTDEVLPSIRKHGAYVTQEKLESFLADPDTMIKTLQALKEERAIRQAAEKVIEEQKPKVLLADCITATTSTILVGEMAKILKQNGIETGQNRLFETLRNDGFLIKREGIDKNMPTQRSMELGLFEIHEGTRVSSTGSKITKTARVTGKGQQYFINMFLSEKPERLSA